MKKITAYTKDQQPHEVTNIIASGNAVDEDSYWLIGIYVSNHGGPIFAVQADNEADAIEEFAASQYGHFILIDNPQDLAEYEEMGVVYWTDAGPCYIDEPIAYMAKVDRWDEFTARNIALKNLPNEIMVNIDVDDDLDLVTITPDDKQEQKWIAATNLYDHSFEIVLLGQEQIKNFVDIYDKSCSDESDDGYTYIIGGYYSMDTWIFRHLLGGQSD